MVTTTRTSAVACVVVAFAIALVHGQAFPGAEPRLFQPGIVSTAAHDFVIRFTPGEDQCYVMRSGQDWFTSLIRYQVSDGRWGKADRVPVTFDGAITYPYISPDGASLIFDGVEGQGTSDIWLARKQGSGWGTPVRLGPEVNSGAVEMHASVAANGNLYFSSNRPGGLGSFDLYRAVKTPAGYAPAENLGPALNSTEFESHPFIAPDESYLVFDSRRAGGYGSNDLYVSFRKPDLSWTSARNLGPGVNTSAGEMRPYVPPRGRVLFFSSDRSLQDPSAIPRHLEVLETPPGGPGNGSQDIWWVSLKVVQEARR